MIDFDVVAVVVTRPLRRDGCMAEDHVAPEAGQISRVWTKARRETKNCQRASGANLRSWTAQNKMRGVLGRVSAGAE